MPHTSTLPARLRGGDATALLELAHATHPRALAVARASGWSADPEALLLDAYVALWLCRADVPDDGAEAWALAAVLAYGARHAARPANRPASRRARVGYRAAGALRGAGRAAWVAGVALGVAARAIVHAVTRSVTRPGARGAARPCAQIAGPSLPRSAS